MVDPLDQLTWFPSCHALFEESEVGIWRQIDRSKRIEYGIKYWREYHRRRGTHIALCLNSSRRELVRKYSRGANIDVGCGTGEFIDWIGGYGYEINPISVDRLKGTGRWLDPFGEIPSHVSSFTCWDVLEHLATPTSLLRRVPEWLFCTVPVFESGRLTENKHFKPFEHLYCFTPDGFEWYLKACGLEIVTASFVEVDCGRESVCTWVART